MRNKKLKQLTQILFAVVAFSFGNALAVDVPRDLRGTEVRQNTVKWEWRAVEEAVRYEVSVNRGADVATSDTKFYSYDLAPGQHVMSVRAVGSDGTVSDSTLLAQITVSESFRFGTHGRSTLIPAGSVPRAGGAPNSASGNFGAPQNPRGAEYSAMNVRWEWDSVAGADAYEVTVDGLRAGTTDELSWESKDLWIGEHSMTVKAIDPAGKLSEQSETVKILVTGVGATAVSENPPEALTQVNSDAQTSDTGELTQVTGLGANEYLGNDVRWTWDAVAGDNIRYEVTVDGIVAGITSELEWVSEDLWEGTHSLTVIAIDASGRRSERSETLKIIVTGNGSEPVGGLSSVAQLDQPADESQTAPPPTQTGGGDTNASKVESMVDPASYEYSEVSNKSGYELVFSDEFNGTEVNPYRWHTQLRWDGDWNGERYEYRLINGEEQFYVNVLSPDPEHQEEIVPLYNPFKFDGNTLSIKATRNPLHDRERRRTHGKMDDIVHQQPFLSGVLSTHKKFARKFGYFEARIKIPSHEGTFPAFWLFHNTRSSEGTTQRTEIDIMENLGHAPHYIYNSFHYFKNVTEYYSGDANFIKPKPSGQIYTGIDYSQNFHVYAVEWSPGKITWFIDGEKVSELYEKEADFEELYLMLNLAIGGNWTNFPTNAGGLGRPSSQRWPTDQDIRDFRDPALEIDYVRVYARR